MNQQINGMNQRSVERKRIHKCIVFLCIITLIFHITFSTRIQAKAASETLALTMAALPLTWELVVPIMVAGGIGTAVWWATRTDVERGEIVNGIKERLIENGKTLVNKYSNVWNGIDYIEGAIHDGLLYVGETYLEEFWGYAQDNNLLGGVTGATGEMTGVNSDSSWFRELTSENFIYESDPLASYQSLQPNNFRLTQAQIDVLTNVLASADGMIVSVSIPNSPGSNFNIVVIDPTLFLNNGYYFTSVNRQIMVGQPLARYYNLYKAGSAVSSSELDTLGRGMTVDKDGGTTLKTLSSVFNIFAVTAVQALGGWWLSNIGMWDITSEGSNVPIGENGQVTDDNGVWTEPWIQGVAKALADYGVGYPVSYGGEIGATWDPSIPIDIDISLPYPDIINPDWDYAGTQADAQAGDYNPPKPIEDEDSLKYPGISGYMPPTGLQSKFPFCIPFDIKAFIALFVTSELTHAPRFVVPLNFSEYGYYEVTIDFTPYDPAAQLFRWLYLALFCIGIITKFDPFTHEV